MDKTATKPKTYIGHSGRRVPVPGPNDELSKREIAKLPKLTIAKRSGPPPHHLEVIDLRKGWGTKLTKNDGAYVRYYTVRYPEAQERSLTGLSGIRGFGMDEVNKGWEVGLPGMKVGGRRELVLPPQYVYRHWKPSWGYKPFVDIYLIDLLGVERGAVHGVAE
ncbi:MAG: FKBP-type peptidyl-prolyl cis-trans isomerase [Chloroflexota bacterium]